MAKLDNSAVYVKFEHNCQMEIERGSFEKFKVNGNSFVAEKIIMPKGSQEFDCRKNSSSSLRPFISSCKGFLKVRELTSQEKKQIQEFRSTQNGKRFL